MSAGARLPPGLEGWGEALNVLTPALVAGLLPLLRALDDLIGRCDARSGASGQPDGYGGLASRGTPERIAMSEWLLAEDIPAEFLRRAAHSELLYLARAFQHPVPRGRVVVLVDNGPGQLGAPRLAQLAALIVLHRRSRSRGSDVAIGLLGDDPHAWLDGNLSRSLRQWQSRRGAPQPSAADVGCRRQQLAPDDEVWILAGNELSAGLTGQPHVLRLSEGAWGAQGVCDLRAELDGDVAELPLPGRELAIRALRGSGFRSAAGLPSAAGSLPRMRDPAFSSAARQLLMRGDGDSEILVTAVSTPGAPRPRVRRHQFPGPVAAAAYEGRRLVALYLDGDEFRVEVAGKPLKALVNLAVPVAAAGFTPDEVVTAARTGGLPPLHCVPDGVICRINGSWWQLSPDSGQELDALAVAPGKQVGLPRMAVRADGGIMIDRTLLPSSADAGSVVIGHGGWCAVSRDRVRWRAHRDRGPAPEITVGDGDEVLALVTERNEPRLVTVSPAGLVVRLVGENTVRTLTRWSGAPGRPVVHPVLPLVAVQRASDLIEVGDLLTGESLQVIRGSE